MAYVNVKACIQKYIEDGMPDMYMDNDPEEDNATPYAWPSLLSHDEYDICSTKAAYDIASKYFPDILPDQKTISPGLQKLFDDAIERERLIASAIKYIYPDLIYNKRLDAIGKPDVVVQNQVIEIKYSRLRDPQLKWIYQVASYMEYLDINLGQIVIWSRIDDEIYSYRVTRNNNVYECNNKTITSNDIAEAKLKILNKVDKIKNLETLLPPFDDPIRFIDYNAVTSQCTYIKDSTPRMYVQCHGTTKSGERCKKIVVDGFLCEYHKGQKITEVEFVDPIIKTTKNCFWYDYCWEGKKVGKGLLSEN